MPRRPKVATLPEPVRKWLDAALADNNFAQYEALEARLAERGYAISKSALHRYGQKLERKLAAIRVSTQAATAIAEAAPDDADLRSAAVMSLVQTEVFNAVVDLQEAAAEDDPAARLKLLASAAQAIAQLARASLHQKRWQTEVAARAESAAAAAEQIARKGGLSADSVAEIRRAILGIASA